MTKKELIENLAKNTQLSRMAAQDFINELAAIVQAEIESGNEITLPGIGILSVTNKAARQGRNPKTGEAITIAAHRVVKFKALKNLKDSANYHVLD